MEYEDKTILCVDCGKEFIHSAQDQLHYANRGLKHDPKRCPSCREAKRNKVRGKRDRPDQSESGAEVSPGSDSSADQAATAESYASQESAGPSRSESQGAGQSTESTEAVSDRARDAWPDPKEYTYTVSCAQCGQETEVPFKPADDFPVYCRTCFLERLPT